jgi:hypothetical protein
LFTSFYPDNGDGNAFIRQANYAKYAFKQVLIPMNKFVTGNNTITLVMPSNSGWVSHLMYDYISLEANVPALPVEFSSFTADAITDKVLLNWKTVTEINNSHFEIERSKDGMQFVQIGVVAGVGNSQLTNQYSFTDALPNIGENYYRLKQVDKDGKYVYSSVRLIKFNSKNLFSVYPNPAKDKLTIQSLTGKNIQSVYVYNAAGKLMYENRLITASQHSIDIAKFIIGFYVAIINDGDKIVPIKFSKE